MKCLVSVLLHANFLFSLEIWFYDLSCVGGFGIDKLIILKSLIIENVFLIIVIYNLYMNLKITEFFDKMLI